MYEKYQTDALVLRSYERGEADRVFAIYTKEFGFVWARASAVRRESSRMRYALQNYSRSNVSLVRGTGGWRAVGATSLNALPTENAQAVAVFARVSRLLERLVRGEERNDYLFATLVEAYSALAQELPENYPTIELLCVARLLYALGYVSAEAVGTALFTHAAYNLPDLAEAEASRTKLLSSVNKAISETQL
ncbi:MAG: recombination protein O N-terminal domain-containing protein [Minisyncoccia bacterium]